MGRPSTLGVVTPGTLGAEVVELVGAAGGAILLVPNSQVTREHRIMRGEAPAAPWSPAFPTAIGELVSSHHEHSGTAPLGGTPGTTEARHSYPR